MFSNTASSTNFDQLHWHCYCLIEQMMGADSSSTFSGIFNGKSRLSQKFCAGLDFAVAVNVGLENLGHVTAMS